MSSHHTLQLVLSLLLCLCLAFTAGFGVYRVWDELEQANRPKPLEVFWEAWDRVEQYFYGTLPSSRERTYGAVHATLGLLNDPYTILVEPQFHELEQDQMRGSFGGIGITLWRDAEGRMMLAPALDSPARRAGVYEGDILLAIDDETITAAMAVDEVLALLHGQAGTPVTLTISRPPTPPFDLTIVREEIQVSSVIWRVLDQAPDVGYIRVEGFTERTDSEIIEALRELRQPGVASLVLDLRDNHGGLIDPAVTTAGQFLHADQVVLYELGRDAGERIIRVQSGGIPTDLYLVVLVNGGTASAAEIVAGALQDHGRAPLIGEPTFGKGAVQLIYDLSDGSSLHVTSATWLTPNRHQIQGQGLTPDVHVPRGDGPQDEQLDRAVAYLQSQHRDDND
ncbi:MAG: S41 family peptidase [Chloroflexota bacterium]|nr:S41 family peptidase [Chloroflexota bacterium]